MLYQHLLPLTKRKLNDNTNHTDTQSVSSTAGSNARRIAANMFFKKSLKQDVASKGETLQRLQDENRRLRQELKDAKSRIRELESAARVDQLQREETTSSSKPSPLPSNAQESIEYRDDDGGGEDIVDESGDFGVEVEATTTGSQIKGEVLDTASDMHSTTSSARTIPTGNDLKSNLHRRQKELRQQLRRSKSSIGRRYSGEDAYLNYFSRLSTPLESITEIDTRRNVLRDDDDYDIASTTSDITASVASSTMLDDESIDSFSLMSGRMLPLRAMKSLLRVSSDQSDAISFVPDDETVLFGEI
jgi:hypothetical protein